MNNDFGDTLRKARGNRTLREAAKLTGLSHTYIRDLELGINRKTNKSLEASNETLKKLADAYGIPYNDLWLSAKFKSSFGNQLRFDFPSMDTVEMTDEEMDSEFKASIIYKTRKYLYEKIDELNKSNKPDKSSIIEELRKIIEIFPLFYDYNEISDHDKELINSFLKALFKQK